MTTAINQPDLIVTEYDSIAVVRHSQGTIEITVDTPANHMEFAHTLDDKSQVDTRSLFMFNCRSKFQITDTSLFGGQLAHMGVNHDAGDHVWEQLGIMDLLRGDIIIAEYESHE